MKISFAQRLFVEGDPRDYFHIRVATRVGIDLISFSVSGRTGNYRLPMDHASIQDCDDIDTCIALTLAPGIPADVDQIALEATSINHRHGVGLQREILGGYLLDGTADQNNTRAVVLIDDPIRRFYGNADFARTIVNGEVVEERPIQLFPRAFEAAIAPGPCGLPATAEEGPWGLAIDNPFSAPAVFSGGADPETCVSVRPELPLGGGGVAALTLPARAVIAQFTHIYVPPVDIAPLVAIPIFDLEIPNEERCNAAQQLVRSAVLDAATEIAADEATGAEVLILDSVQLATLDGVLCRQASDRFFDPYVVADQIEERITERFGPDRRVRVAVIYATNLDLALPGPLVSAFSLLESELDVGAPDRRGMLVAIGPDATTSALGPDRSGQWLASEEPAFRDSIKGLLRTVWPFRTVLHNDQTVVPLASVEERDRFEAYRICIASEQVLPLGTTEIDNGVFFVGDTGPAYRVRLSPQILIDSSAFILPTIQVTWEACLDLCDHATPTQDPSIPWERASACLM